MSEYAMGETPLDVPAPGVSSPEGHQSKPQPQAAPSAEQRAREQGWLPFDEFKQKFPDLPNDKWRPAEEFVERGQWAGQKPDAMVDNLVRMERQIDSLNATVRNLATTQSKSFMKGMEAKEKELRAQLNQATAEGNVAAVNQISNELVGVAQEKAEMAVAGAKDDEGARINLAVNNFRAKNPWTSDPVVFSAFQSYLNANTPLDDSGKPAVSDHEGHFEQVAAKFKAQYPTMFGNPARTAPTPTPTASSALNQGGSKGKTWDDMDASLQQMAMSYISSGAFGDATSPAALAKARQRYVDEMVATGAL